MCVMLFRVGKFQLRLTDRAAVLAEQSGDVHYKFDLFLSNRQHLECSSCLAVADYMVALARRTDYFVGVN